MISNKIQSLRKQKKLSQSELARKLGITRSSVNAWEQGISVPSTQYIIELSELFNVSTDFLLGVEKTSTISLDNLTYEDTMAVQNIVEHLRKKNKKN